MGLVLKYNYGTAEILRYERLDRGYVRVERYVPNDGGRSTIDKRHCAGPKDVSLHQSTSNYGPGHGYDSRCGWCYLGKLHTQDAHRQSIKRGARS